MNSCGPDNPNGCADMFNEYRRLLLSVAYRMLGTMADAEDIVQDAFMRWQQTAVGSVESPRAYLVTIVSRMCIDYLKSARVRREQYVGPWLPEPLITNSESASPMRGTEYRSAAKTQYWRILQCMRCTTIVSHKDYKSDALPTELRQPACLILACRPRVTTPNCRDTACHAARICTSLPADPPFLVARVTATQTERLLEFAACRRRGATTPGSPSHCRH
jgi:RNA polymerase sigma factor (sigma-70 family)